MRKEGLNVYDILKHKNSSLRKKAIELLGTQYFTNPSSFEDVNIEVMYDLWMNLILWKKDTDYIRLENYSENSLKEFFSEEYMNHLQEMLMFEIHPLTLVKYLIAYYPRSYLIKLIREDPNSENRAFAYKILQGPEFWITSDQKAIGPYELWAHTIKQTINSLKFETDNNVLTEASMLLSTSPTRNTTRAPYSSGISSTSFIISTWFSTLPRGTGTSS